MNLKDAGLTENEDKVYTSLIELGPTLAGRISRKTGLHRRTIYDITETLIKKGLVSYMLENNRRIFSAVNPQRIIDSLDEKKNTLIPLIDSLKQKFGLTKKKEQTNFYKGKNGLKMIFESQLEYNEILILGATKEAYKAMPYYFKWFNERRKKKRVRIRVITTDKEIRPKILAKTRYLAEKYSQPLVINIYGGNVAMILWGKDPFAVVVQQDEFALGYRKYFEILWKVAKK